MVRGNFMCFTIFDRKQCTEKICSMKYSDIIDNRDSTNEPCWRCPYEEKGAWKCIPMRHVCNGIEQCRHGSDEWAGCEEFPGNND